MKNYISVFRFSENTIVLGENANVSQWNEILIILEIKFMFFYVFKVHIQR